MVKIDELKFDEKGLIPAIVVDAATKRVLMLAYMSLADNKGKKYGLGTGINHKREDSYRAQLKELGLGLEDKLNVRIGSLSGGQRQAVAMKTELPTMDVGDTVRVDVKIKEGSRERVQAFEGTIIARKHGGLEESITVRRISYGVGCEKVFPIHSPNVVNVETVRKGKVHRAKLYYLRDRLGKSAKVKEKV